MVFDQIVIVYDADGGVWGEISYIAKKVVRLASCALCDITHGVTGMRRAWKRVVARLPVPVDALHRNETDSAMRAAIGDQLPCVLARTGQAYEVIVSPAKLAACEASPEALGALIDRAMGAAA